jgi:hypothetical protein
VCGCNGGSDCPGPQACCSSSVCVANGAESQSYQVCDNGTLVDANAVGAPCSGNPYCNSTALCCDLAATTQIGNNTVGQCIAFNCTVYGGYLGCGTMGGPCCPASAGQQCASGLSCASDNHCH